jgi:hypothetical protein
MNIHIFWGVLISLGGVGKLSEVVQNIFLRGGGAMQCAYERHSPPGTSAILNIFRGVINVCNLNTLFVILPKPLLTSCVPYL